jgi:hypothetical protein
LWDKNLFSSDVNLILDYLAHLPATETSYNLINIQRSILSVTQQPVNGFPIGQYPLIVKLLKDATTVTLPTSREQRGQLKHGWYWTNLIIPSVHTKKFILFFYIEYINFLLRSGDFFGIYRKIKIKGVFDVIYTT